MKVLGEKKIKIQNKADLSRNEASMGAEFLDKSALFCIFIFFVPEPSLYMCVRVDVGRQFAFKTRFFNFPHRGETKKHPWDQILQFRFPATILGGLFQAAEEAGLTKVDQLRSKRVFSTFLIGAKRKNTLGIEFYNFGFMPPFWVGLSKQRKKPG